MNTDICPLPFPIMLAGPFILNFFIKLYRILIMKTPPPAPRSSVQRWFRLSFCTPFSLAQFCKKPSNPGYQCSSVLQRKWRTHSECVLCFLCLLRTSCIKAQGGFWALNLPCRKHSTLHWHTIRWQNNAILRRAALSNPKPAQNRAR
jgi:hypothetical protein